MSGIQTANMGDNKTEMPDGITKVTSDGWATGIPKEVQEALTGGRLSQGDKVYWFVEGGTARIVIKQD